MNVGIENTKATIRRFDNATCSLRRSTSARSSIVASCTRVTLKSSFKDMIAEKIDRILISGSLGV